MTPSITYKDIFLTTSNGVIATDNQGCIKLINSNAEGFLSLKRRNVLDIHIYEVLPTIGELVSKCLKSGQPQLGRHIHDSTNSLVVNVTAIIKSEKITGTVSNFQKLQQFEASARKLHSYKSLNRQLNTIFQYSSESIWLYDGDGKVININKAAEILNNIKAKDIIGKSYAEVIEMSIIERSIVPEVLKAKRQVSSVSDWSQHSTGLITGTPVFDDDGNIIYIVVNARDMTQLNQMKEKLERERQVTDKYKDELAELKLTDLKKHKIIAKSKAMRQILRVALKLAKIEPSNILILGESGTGKGLIAKFIHKTSRRNKMPLIQINCAALPESLLEAELFGYEKGSFTGARKQGKIGLIELAHNGTLFLDEIGDLPLSLQAKLLKYLDDHEILRLGGLKPKKIDCIVIVATNRNIETLTQKRGFRRDLFYRLNTFTIKIPPLRQRPEDIFGLINYYLGKYNRRYKRKTKISANAMDDIQGYSFYGNVRELKNALQTAIVLGDSDLLDKILARKLNGASRSLNILRNNEAHGLNLTTEIRTIEKEILKQAIMCCKSTREMAHYLSLNQSNIVRKLKKHGLSLKS